VATDAIEKASEPNVDILDWDVDIQEEGETISAALEEIEEIPAGVEIAVEGDAPTGQYLYVLLIDDSRHEVIVLFDSGKPIASEDLLRVPATGWITMPATGIVRVAASDIAVAADEWASILDVRDPPPSSNGDQKQ
jgi:hypothetical protein